MAKDLDIHEHYSNHADGKPCELGPIECLVHTRVWQALLVVEVMIGGPQGKSTPSHPLLNQPASDQSRPFGLRC